MQSLVINNEIKVIGASEKVVNYCKNVLTLTNPDYVNAKKMNRYTGNIPEKIKLYVRNGLIYILPFGCLRDIWRLEPNTPYHLGFHDFWGSKLEGNIKLYDYQENAKNALKSARNGVLEAPCGSGKTMIGLQLIKEIGGKALWLTHTKKLLEQSMERCKAHYKGDFGTITEGQVNIGRDITFATVQTMSKVDASIYRDAFDIVVVDECHHCVGAPTRMQEFYKVVNSCNARYKYGLSATLERKDGLIQSLFAIIGELVYSIPKSAVGDKIIKARHERVDVDIQYGVREYSGYDGKLDYMKLINALTNNQERNKIIVDNIVKNATLGKKQIVLCLRVKQCQDIVDMLTCRGVSTTLITGQVREKSRNYTSDVIVATYALAKEGLDIPSLDIVHLATPSKDRTTVVQSVGRVERNQEGKEQPVCYDYVDVNIPYCVGCYKQRVRYLK